MAKAAAVPERSRMWLRLRSRLRHGHAVKVAATSLSDSAQRTYQASVGRIDTFCDAIWLEHGLSRNTLSAISTRPEFVRVLASSAPRSGFGQRRGR